LKEAPLRGTAVVCAGLLVSHVGVHRDVWTLPLVQLPALFEPQLPVPPACDLTQYEMHVMDGWRPLPIVVTGEEIRSDRHLWRETFFRNWDVLPDGVREAGLDAMWSRLEAVLEGPERWECMRDTDWDEVPQPVRAMAVLRMVEGWREHYRVGEAFGLAAERVVERLQAVAMAESWFQHRAQSLNTDGTADIGIGQASTTTRSRIRYLYVQGLSDFGLAEEEYLDPWKATRALVFWFSLLLDEAAGDLDLATRAYNVGIARALAGAGAAYLESVERREADYLRGGARRPTWQWLRERLQAIVVVAPPPGDDPSLADAVGP
jgi:hypothetical protein